MSPVFPVLVIILAIINRLAGLDVRAIDDFITNQRPAMGIGVVEQFPSSSRPELAIGIGTLAISKDTEETISYAGNLLTGRLESPSNLPKLIYDTGDDVNQGITKMKELDARVHPTMGETTEYLSSKTAPIISRKHRQVLKTRVKRNLHPASPCPGVFSYDGTSAGKERWSGVVLVSTDEMLTGVRLEIELDKPAELLDSSLGAVISLDNKKFKIWNGRKKIEPGKPLSVTISVQYSGREVEPPRIKTIKLNGNKICPKKRGSDSVPPKIPPARPTLPTQTGGGVSLGIVDAVACGIVGVQPSPLITHAQHTSRGQWPWHAALYQSKGADLSYICGGSLIGKNVVLTAAHCVTRGYNGRPTDPEALLVYLGKFHLKLWSEGGVQGMQIRDVHVHPDYNSTNFHADIAILVLLRPVDFTIYVRPVCLWDRNRSHLSEVEGQSGVVVGWGFDEHGTVTEELMMANMPVVSQQTCIYSYPEFFSHFTSERTFCAGFRNGTSVCNGDSGGGMVFPTTSQPGVIWSLRGIVSISTPLQNKGVCNPKHYVVFTDVAKFLDWIQKYL